MSGGALTSLDDVRAAAERLRGLVDRTPLLPDEGLSAETGADVRLKCESLQRTGSFKARGACNFVSQLSAAELERGVITYSSGNHAQAVAYAVRLRGARAVVVMPTTAPKIKSDGARRLGAQVEFAGTTSEERRVRAEEIAAEEGLVIVPPFDHPRIIAGQGTVALETEEDWPGPDLFLVPVGGGGLASGCGAAFGGLGPATKVVGVEPEGAPSMRRALDAGAPVTLAGVDTVADGLAPTRAGDLTHVHAEAFLDDVALVSDDEIRSAAAYLVRRRKLVVEHSGAATVAALRSGRIDVRGRRVCAVLSGGNLDGTLLAGIASAADRP